MNPTTPTAHATTSASASAAPASLRLWLARGLAWTVHTGAWLVLGAWGQHQLPLWAGGLLPVVLWLGLLGLALRARAGQPLAAPGVRAAWLAGGGLLLLAWGTTAGGALPPSLAQLFCALLAATGFAALAAASSWTVRLLRSPQRAPLHHALAPAVLGVALAGYLGVPWLLGVREFAGLGDSAVSMFVVAVVLLFAMAGAGLTLRRGPAARACRHGLFEEWRGLQGSDAAPWRLSWLRGGDAPQRLAALAMLPMMAGLPALLSYCSRAGNGAGAVAWMHLAAMVMPAALLTLTSLGRACATATAPATATATASARCDLQHGPPPIPRWHTLLTTPWLCAALLVAGGVALLAQPMLGGLMTASLLHAAAWSVSWVGGLAQAQGPAQARAQLQAQAWRAARAEAGAPGWALSSAGVVLALGIGLSWLGPLALWLAHLVPALLALAWMARHFIRQPLPATRF